MRLSPRFFDLALLPRARARAEEKIAAGELKPDNVEAFIRGYCKLPSGESGTRPTTIDHSTEIDIMSTNITASTDLSTVATKDLVAFHNEHAESPVKKFATRAKAEERVAALLAEMKPKKRGKKKDKPATDVDRSAAIASSWADPSVRAARTARHPVKVKGIVYRSVRAAFAELGLPDNQHQKFRKELVEKGRATFDGHIFTIVEAE